MVEPIVYGGTRRVWVEDGHVFIEGHDGAVLKATPEIAIEMGRLISQAGADALINKVMHRAGGPDGQPLDAAAKGQ